MHCPLGEVFPALEQGKCRALQWGAGPTARGPKGHLVARGETRDMPLLAPQLFHLLEEHEQPAGLPEPASSAPCEALPQLHLARRAPPPLQPAGLAYRTPREADQKAAPDGEHTGDQDRV